ncbi:PD-(D/E)XK nuclease family protein [Christensenella intestinihominis]|uniref:PD-(D/E)XK nuclease family protein n=1 Tax=Christensenella intestinihominis TaxID=1851429 RepID=UPI0008346C77|nr:PD-(D/E)XK nuclease family protein [Christensenella intestinihominis]
MGVTFVLGRTASQRDERVIGKIKQIAEKDPLAEVLVVVPPQSTYITEKQLMQALHAKGLMGICVQSPARVADRVLESTYGRTVQSIDTAGKSMLLRAILDKETPELSALARCAGKSDLPVQLADLISELKTLDVTPEMLLGVETEHAAMREKLKDIAHLYGRFNEAAEGLFDTEDKINLVIDHIPEADFIRRSHLVIHGFDIYNAQTVRFMKALMHTARDTVMSFYYAPAGAPDAAMYEICNENRNKFLADAMRLGLETEIVTEDRRISPDILHIEKNLYAYPAKQAGYAKDVSVTHAADVEEEVRAVCAQVVWLNRNRGYAYRDMAVVCGSGQRYVPTVTRVFRQAGVPCFAGEKRTLDQCAFSAFLLSTLELMQGKLKKDTLVAHAKTGLCNLTEKEICAMENYAFSNVRDGFAFTFPFRDAGAEQAREKLMEPILRMREAARTAGTAGQLLNCAADYMDALDAVKKLNRQIDRAQKAGLMESAEWNAQVAEKTMRILGQAREILGDMPMKKTQLAGLLKTGLRAQKVGVIPPGADEVAVGEISYIRLGDVKAVFVLGANDGILPNYEQSSDILADYERELLLSQLAGLQFTDNVEKQKLAILKTFTKPGEKLYLSFVDDGREKPSPLLDKLHELFGGIRQNEAGGIALMLKQNAYLKTAQALRSFGSGQGLTCAGEVAAAVLQDEEFPRKQRAILWGARSANAARQLKPETAGELYREMKGSASRLEQYYECPYKHFIGYGLKVRPPREYTIDPLDVGNYAHKILETLTNRFRETGERWADVPDGRFDEYLSCSARQAREEQSKYTLNKHNENVLRAVEREVDLAARAIRRQSGQSALQPRESECWFEKEFPDGLTLTGKIDRIDTAELDGTLYFEIVDYKTGEPHFSLRELAGGLSLQLMIYIMAAAELLGEDAQFAGANYFRIHLPEFGEEGKNPEEDFNMEGVCGVDFDTAQKLYGGEGDVVMTVALSRKKDGGMRQGTKERMFSAQEIGTLLSFTRELVERAVRGMRQGDTQIRPYLMDGRMGCDYCEFAGVCMFDEAYGGNKPRVIEKTTREELLGGTESETAG